MSSVGRYEFAFGASRFVLCPAMAAGSVGGHVVAGSRAEQVIASLLRDGQGWIVRRAYAELSDAFVPHGVSDDQILRWFSAQLGGDLSYGRRARLALVEGDRDALGTNATEHASGRGEAQRIAAALRADDARNLLYRGQEYRLVAASDQRAAKGRDFFEAVNAGQALALITEMAAEPSRPEATRALLSEAARWMEPATRHDPSEELVLLRRHRSYVRELEEPASTPSQLRSVQKTDWLEIRFVDDEGEPIANQAYAVRLADGSMREGTLDGNGMAYLAGVASGACEVSFPGFAPTVAN